LLDGLDIDQQVFAQIAFDEIVAWLRGSNRPGSLSELEVERLWNIFSHASDPGGLTEDRLIRDLKFPLGKVRYLMASVRKKYPKSLSPIISKIESAVKSAQPGDDKGKTLVFPIGDDEAYILRQIAKDNSWTNEKIKLQTLGLRQYQVVISAGLKDPLLQELKKYE